MGRGDSGGWGGVTVVGGVGWEEGGGEGGVRNKD